MDKFEKTVLSGVVVTKVKEKGGKFLKQDLEGWFEITDIEARDKVSHAFRNRRLATKGSSSTQLNKHARSKPNSVLSRPLIDADSSCLIKRRKLIAMPS